MRRIVTQARVTRHGSAEFVSMQTATGGEFSVLLDAGKGLQQSLHDSAAELRERARRLLRQANMIDQARAIL
jgi:hypothetical protein